MLKLERVISSITHNNSCREIYEYMKPNILSMKTGGINNYLVTQAILINQYMGGEGKEVHSYFSEGYLRI